MPETMPTAKAALRNQVQALLKQMPAEERAKASIQACSRLKQQAVWKNARLILFFAPLPQELDVWPLLLEALQGGKQVALPRFDLAASTYVACRVEHPDRDLVSGKFGIREPGALCRQVLPPGMDLILVPGVAFDLNGRRLGRGRGFYDRLLARLRSVKCGVAFDPQIVSQIPAEEHDLRLDCLLTPTRWTEFQVELAPPIF
jgi:5-formyltetrahydrofolate cyclo-ligase